MTRFQTKKCNFHIRFQTWPLGRNYAIITSSLKLERKRKNYSNPFRILIFLFLSYSSGIETINTFIHSVFPSKTIPDSRSKWTNFRPKRGKTLPDGAAHTNMVYIREYPPGLNLEGRLTESFLRYRFGLYLEGLVHGRAYFRNFMVDHWNILVFPKVCTVPCFFNVRSTILHQGGLHY